MAAALDACAVTFEFADGAQRTMLDGEDVSQAIRVPEISQIASKTSAFPCVRALLLDVQRAFASGNNMIMDGRDIGTTILPDAPIKIFLTASAEDRARRRFEELAARGEPVTYETVFREQKERDFRDETREISPLRRADDAMLVDTTGLSLEEGYLKLRRTIDSAWRRCNVAKNSVWHCKAGPDSQSGQNAPQRAPAGWAVCCLPKPCGVPGSVLRGNGGGKYGVPALYDKGVLL